MAGSTISGVITSTVTLGSTSFSSPLTVTASGDIAISAYGATAIYGAIGSGSVLNQGTITGGTGSITSTFGGDGGDGLYLLAGVTATNDGTISGGAAGMGTELGGGGGIGVYLVAGATLTNDTSITGGMGGAAGSSGSRGTGGWGVVSYGAAINSGTITGGNGYGGRGYGGSGVGLFSGQLTNTDTGTIIGGSGDLGGGTGSGFFSQDANGVYLAAGGTLVNQGTIIGGHGLFFGGSGVFLASGATLALAGTVIGGSATQTGGKGLYLAGAGSLTITGGITGGAGQFGGSGVNLANGGTLGNAGSITGGSGYADTSGAGGSGGDGVSLAHAGIVVNTGLIAGGVGGATSAGNGGTGGDGADLTQGGTLTNSAGATIRGGSGGYGAYNGGYGGIGANLTGGSLTNAGTIDGGAGAGTGPYSFGGNGDAGVSLTAGAVLTNTGLIDGGTAGYGYFGSYGADGVSMGSAKPSSTLVNSGLITGGNGGVVALNGSEALFSYGMIIGGAGVSVGAGDTLVNISAVTGGAGISIAAGGTFTNIGHIYGAAGVAIATGGTLANTGSIASGAGAYLAAGGTLINAGVVGGGTYGGLTADAVLFAAAGRLVVDPVASFIGSVAGTGSVLELAAGSSTGTLGGIGTQFLDFATVTLDAGAYWTLTGTNTIAAGTTLTEAAGASLTDTGTLVNDGTIGLDPSILTVAALTGTGLVTIAAGSTLGVAGTITAGETLSFAGNAAYLHLYSPTEVTGRLTNFAADETIDLRGVDATTVGYASGQLTFGSGGDIPLALADGGTMHASASADGTDVTLLCFCANTLILTPNGERPVQDLAPGDLVVTHRGDVRPIVWVGAGKVLATRGRRGPATPVIVRKGALGPNLPTRDLRVTKGHALWFDDVLIPVGFLVNHRLIEWDDRAQEVELYHLELASHDVLVANGAPAESYRDDGNRWLFHNANEGWHLPPKPPCAPVLTGGPVVDAVWRRLLDQAGPRPGFILTDDPDLYLLVDGKRLDTAERHGSAHVFRLPAQPGSIRIASRAAAPAELGLARDPRVLGVALRRIALRQSVRFHIVEASDTRLTEGFHRFEAANSLRWTDGDAVFPAVLLQDFDGPTELVLHLGGTTRYPLAGQRIHAA